MPFASSCSILVDARISMNPMRSISDFHWIWPIYSCRISILSIHSPHWKSPHFIGKFDSIFAECEWWNTQATKTSSFVLHLASVALQESINLGKNMNSSLSLNCWGIKGDDSPKSNSPKMIWPNIATKIGRSDPPLLSQLAFQLLDVKLWKS